MFVRVKETPNSPRKSVQIVASYRVGDKVRQKIVRYVGIAHDDDELEKLKLLAQSIKIKLEAGAQEMLMPPEELARINLKAKEAKYTDDDYKVNIKDLEEEARVVSGIHDIYERLFYELGYERVISNPKRNKSAVNIFKDIVLARIANPASKRSSVDMLEEDFGINLPLDRVYRMMDKLDTKAIERLQAITYENTASLFGGKINVIFFDATTIYFESFTEDDLKRCGYSKDKKFGQPQVLFSLLVTTDGLPIGYRIFPGNRYEGHTLIPALSQIKKKYDVEKVIFVADSAMLSGDNISYLEREGFCYIVGARLKSLPRDIKEKILDKKNYTDIEPGYSVASFKYNKKRLIVSYSEKRAKKDSHDRETAILAIQKKMSKTKNPKEYMSSYGYKKYIKLGSKSSVEIDEEKVKADSRWDGLLGVVTNDKDISPQEVLGFYHNLYNVEAAFRVTKHDLKVRPIFHWKPSRISAHIAICFCAYALVKHLEYRVRLLYKKMSPERIRQTLIKVQTSILFDKKKRIRYALPSRLSADARKIYDILKVKKTITPYIIKKL